MRTVQALIAICLILGSVGCKNEIGHLTRGKELPTTAKADYYDLSALAPNTEPGSNALLRLAGTEVPVGVECKEANGKFSVDLLAHGEVLEHETYQLAGNQFLLLDAAGNQYNPGIPLLAVPLLVGSGWKWQGTEVVGERSRGALATLSTSSDKLYVAGVPVDTVKVSVDLELLAEGEVPKAQRALAFWFAPGKGLIKREFGSASVREPVEP